MDNVRHDARSDILNIKGSYIEPSAKQRITAALGQRKTRDGPDSLVRFRRGKGGASPIRAGRVSMMMVLASFLPSFRDCDYFIVAGFFFRNIESSICILPGVFSSLSSSFEAGVGQGRMISLLLAAGTRVFTCLSRVLAKLIPHSTRSPSVRGLVRMGRCAQMCGSEKKYR